ncbi:E3 SUMO-protein ligase gei-17-like [Palaemon carinicauda]|uniref:E3 SUMO-protein ligase gei-17-like n=1 Tax=Palaemon carinicauda TaxID=392227 RepID=UPI0035B61025
MFGNWHLWPNYTWRRELFVEESYWRSSNPGPVFHQQRQYRNNGNIHWPVTQGVSSNWPQQEPRMGFSYGTPTGPYANSCNTTWPDPHEFTFNRYQPESHEFFYNRSQPEPHAVSYNRSWPQPHAVSHSRSRPEPHAVPCNTTRPVPQAVSCNTTRPVPQAVSCNTTRPVPQAVSCNTTWLVPQAVSCNTTRPVPQAVSCNTTRPVPQAVPCNTTRLVPQAVSCNITQPVPQAVSCNITQPVPQAVSCNTTQPVPQAVSNHTLRSEVRVVSPEKPRSDDRTAKSYLGKLGNMKMKPLATLRVVKNVLAEEYYGSFFKHSKTYEFKIDAGLAVHQRPDFEVVLRMALLCPRSIPVDELPFNVKINVNGTIATVLNAKSPVIITKLCKSDSSINSMCICSERERGRAFFVRVIIMARRSVDELCQKLKRRSPSRALEGIKKSAFQKGSDIMLASSYPVSLECPLLRKRIELPGRSTRCTHPQCFDLWSYIQLNANKGSWSCPICLHDIGLDNLYVDEFIEEVLKATSSCVMKIFLCKDGSWASKSEDENGMEKENKSPSKNRILVIDLSDSDEENSQQKKRSKTEEKVKRSESSERKPRSQKTRKRSRR